MQKIKVVDQTVHRRMYNWTDGTKSIISLLRSSYTGDKHNINEESDWFLPLYQTQAVLFI